MSLLGHVTGLEAALGIAVFAMGIVAGIAASMGLLIRGRNRRR